MEAENEQTKTLLPSGMVQSGIPEMVRSVPQHNEETHTKAWLLERLWHIQEIRLIVYA